MKSISRYIFKQAVTTTFFVTLALTMAIWLTQSLRLIDFIVNRGLPASTFFVFIGLLLPSFLGLVLPVSTFVSVLFIYYKLMNDSELVVLRSAGLSPLQLASPALALAGLVTLICYSISLYFLPISYREFKDMQYKLRSDYSSVVLQEGEFNTITPEITVYIRERADDGQLRGILVHDNRDQDRPVTMMAESGALVPNPAGPRVVMKNGNRQEVERGTGRLSLLYFDSYTVEIASLSDSPGARWREPRERFIFDLLGPDPNHPEDVRLKDELIAEGHQRIVAPIYAIAFVLVALASLLSGEFNRRGQTKRIVFAVLCITTLQAMSLGLNDVTIQHPALMPVKYGVVILVVLGAAWYMVRSPKRKTIGPQAAASPV
ncbi:MAG: LPS export ABC transporter permease LptF [Pseudomonadota bacterium]